MRVIVWVLGWIFLEAYIYATTGSAMPLASVKPVFIGGLIWAGIFDLVKE